MSSSRGKGTDWMRVWMNRLILDSVSQLNVIDESYHHMTNWSIFLIWVQLSDDWVDQIDRIIPTEEEGLIWTQFDVIRSQLNHFRRNWMKFIWFMRFLFHFFIEIWMQYHQWNRSFWEWIWLILFGDIWFILSYFTYLFQTFWSIWLKPQ